MPGDVQGLEGVRKLLKDFPAELEAKILKGAMKAAADEMVTPLQHAAPVWTGRLEESIAARSEPKKQRLRNAGEDVVTAVVWIKRPGRWWWFLTEYGTRFMPARPWARPAFAANHKKVIAAVVEYVRKRAVREARKIAKAKGSAGG